MPSGSEVHYIQQSQKSDIITSLKARFFIVILYKTLELSFVKYFQKKKTKVENLSFIETEDTEKQCASRMF